MTLLELLRFDRSCDPIRQLIVSPLRRLFGELIIILGVWERSDLSWDAATHKLAVAFFYACAILSLPITVHAVARAGMDKAEFQDLYLKARGVTLGLVRAVREAPGRLTH